MTKARQLRSHFSVPKHLIRLVGAHSGLSAKLVEKHGFEGIWASGFEIATLHAVPDANILTVSELLKICVSMNDASSLPIIVDGDTGFGNANNVIHMVNKFERAGIAAICFEDKLFPKVNSFISGRQPLAPIAEFVGKIMAAKNTQNDPDFMIIARVEALIAGHGMDEALKRANAYADAGADAILIHSKAKTDDEIRTFAKRWKKRLPLIIVPTTYPNIKEEDLPDLGVKVVIYANHGIRAAIRAMDNVFSEISRTKGIASINSNLVSMAEAFDLQGMHKIKENEKRFVREQESVSGLILAAGDSSHEEGMQTILQNHPVALLDINGKTVLQRITETMNISGIQDINVVVGFCKELFTEPSLTFIENSEFAVSGILTSLMKGLENIESSALVTYSDIIITPRLIKQLLMSNEEITIVVDASYKKSDINRRRDYVVTKYPPIESERIVNRREKNYVTKIGSNVSLAESHYEFTGITLFSQKAVRKLKQLYSKWSNGSSMKTFSSAPNIFEASLNDLLEKWIEEGGVVCAMEVGEGWSEIRTFDDYSRLNKLISERGFD